MDFGEILIFTRLHETNPVNSSGLCANDINLEISFVTKPGTKLSKFTNTIASRKYAKA